MDNSKFKSVTRRRKEPSRTTKISYDSSPKDVDYCFFCDTNCISTVQLQCQQKHSELRLFGISKKLLRKRLLMKTERTTNIAKFIPSL